MRLFVGRFFFELVSQQSQFLFFTILLKICAGSLFGGDPIADIVLVAAWAIQSLTLAAKGHRQSVRFFGSFLAPLLYTAALFRADQGAVASAHVVAVWAFALWAGTFKTLGHAVRKLRALSEVFLQLATIFAFIYFLYYDASLAESAREAAMGLISPSEAAARLSILRFPAGFGGFMETGTNVYLLVLVAALSLYSLFHSIRAIDHVDRTDLLLLGLRSQRPAPGEAAAVKPARRKVALVYADVRGFGSLIDKGDPQDIVDTAGLYYASWEAAVREKGGYIDRYVGDSMLAVFDMEDGSAACEAAMEAALGYLDERLKNLQGELASRGLPVIRAIGVGAHFGEAVVGPVASGARVENCIFGEAVNVASRMESLGREYKQKMLISEDIYREMSIELQSRFAAIGEVLLKGSARGINVFASKK